MDWVTSAPALLQLWYPGHEGGNALADVLFGEVDASGRLPTTFPMRIEDNPTHTTYPGENGRVIYGEGLFVGYRYYDHKRIEPLFPGIQVYPDAMACGLSSMNPVVHPAGVLMNAGRIERSHGEFYFYEEGVTPAVVRAIMAVDEERRAIGELLGYELMPVNEAFHQAGFGPRGDLWAAINGSYMLTRLKAPGSLESRWLTEDVPYGLAAWVSIGRQFGVATPVMESLVNLATPVMGFDGFEAGRGVEALGIAGLGRDELKEFLAWG